MAMSGQHQTATVKQDFFDGNQEKLEHLMTLGQLEDDLLSIALVEPKWVFFQ
jgi:hypothetical protein